MTLFQHPLLTQLADAKRILLAGAGGGFDIYSGIPLYFALKAQGKNVTLANLSFTDLNATTSKPVTAFCYKIQSDDKMLTSTNYFPEKYLKMWLESAGETTDLYAFERNGVQPISRVYKYLVRKHQIDTIILIDGGTDSLMFGDEAGLGTPEEDIVSISAAFHAGVDRSFLVCLGFGIDYFHGVSHYLFLENVSTMIKNGGYLGAFSIQKEMQEAQYFKNLIEFANKMMQGKESIVSNSISSALEGVFGDSNFSKRVAYSELWINPLMAMYWCFDLRKVVAANKYYELIKNTNTIGELNKKLSDFRENLEIIRERKIIPH